MADAEVPADDVSALLALIDALAEPGPPVRCIELETAAGIEVRFHAEGPEYAGGGTLFISAGAFDRAD